MPEKNEAGLVVEVLNEMIRSGKYALIFTLIKAFRQGLVYGAKVRAPHATVLELVWGSGSLQKIPGKVLRLTSTHALGLGFSSVIFTIVTRLLRALTTMTQQNRETSSSLVHSEASPSTWWHHTVAGFLVGYFAWGNATSKVHQQMLIYVVSRLLVAVLQIVSLRVGYNATPLHYRLFSGAMWALLMTILFAVPRCLQVNMRKSLEYVFLETDRFTCIRELIGRHGQ